MSNYPLNDYRDYLMHSAKGTRWKKGHKYIAIINGRYIYPKAQETAWRIKSGVSSGYNTVRNAVSNGARNVASGVSSSYNYGRNAARNVAGSVSSGYRSGRSMASSTAKKITNSFSKGLGSARSNAKSIAKRVSSKLSNMSLSTAFEERKKKKKKTNNRPISRQRSYGTSTGSVSKRKINDPNVRRFSNSRSGINVPRR